MFIPKNQTRSPRVLISLSMMIVVTIIIAVASSVSYGQSCQSHQGSSFTFRPKFSGDSMTVSIGLSPCETVSLSEAHDMHGDPNKGTNIRMTYTNGSGQTLRSEQFAGIFSGGYTFPAGAPWPFPWRGTVSANWTVASLKIESYGAYGKGADGQEPEYNFTLSFSQRNGYNTSGDSFGSAANAALPSTYQGSFYDSTATPTDAGQYFKVHLTCNQAMYVYGSVTGSSQYGAGFRVDIYDSNQTLLTPFGWKSLAAYGTVSFVSNSFTNPNNAEADFYIRVKSTAWPVYDFTLNIEEYVASNSQTTPRTTAADATGTGASVSSEEYHLPATVDNDVLTNENTELWAKVYRPTDISGGPYPLVMFLHGNHGTCGHLSNPRVDDNSDYTSTGTCPAGYSVVPNHLGYEYLANQLASRGYIVVSINANRGITGGQVVTHSDDPDHIFSRGRLVLKHLETLSTWNNGPGAFITGKTLGTSRNDASGWYGMSITVGAQPITVHTLGRLFVTGNTATHTVKIIRASDSADLGSVSLSMTGGTNGQFKYANLATPVTLAANTTYYIASEETASGDSWYDSNTSVTSSALAAVNGRVSSADGTTWSTAGATAGQVYVPLDFKFQVLSVNLASKIDFANVGLMGHSRGGQGVRAAYNLYRTPSIDPRGVNITWSSKIPGMSIKGIFEVAPTDFPVPTQSNGSGVRYLNGDATAWNVLVGMCDGDVVNLQGVRGFDRIMPYTGNVSGVPSDNPAKQKSMYAVRGANHNFFNTEWQTLDFQLDPDPLTSPCLNQNRLFPHPITDGSGSADQRTVASASLLAFFRANVGSGATASFNQNFNPLNNVPSVVTSLTTVERGFTISPNSTLTKVIFDFIDPALPSPYPDPPAGTTYDNPNTQFSYGRIREHDYDPDPDPDPVALKLGVGHITWTSANCGNYFQANWKALNSGESISAYKTLDFRVMNRNSALTPSDPINFQIQLVKADGTVTGAAVSLKSYLRLETQGGVNLLNLQFYHGILQTVRIPLTDFTGANLSSIRGVRFVFSDTPEGAISLANIRLSKEN